jgi:hypothetical protein
MDDTLSFCVYCKEIIAIVIVMACEQLTQEETTNIARQVSYFEGYSRLSSGSMLFYRSDVILLLMKSS